MLAHQQPQLLRLQKLLESQKQGQHRVDLDFNWGKDKVVVWFRRETMKPKLGDCGGLQILEFIKVWNVIITR